MSHGYGFLTQSTILPKKGKQIKLSDNSGQLLLQSLIQKQKQKLKNLNKSDHSKINPTAKAPKKNPGIQQRIKKDEQQVQSSKLIQKNYYKHLQKKSQIYNKISQKKLNIDKLLVDFQQKPQSTSQMAEYQALRSQFYQSQIHKVQSQQKALHETIQTETSTKNQLRERLAWEKQTLNQLNNIQGNVGDNLGNKPKVVQSFDNRLSKDEREAFDNVLEDEERERSRIEAIKRRKELKDGERIRKLRNLNILLEGQDESVRQQGTGQRDQKDQNNQKKDQNNYQNTENNNKKQ